MTPRVLVAGIGNIFLGDDGFGPEVVSRLAAGEVPADAGFVDYGIRGMHLAYDLLSGCETGGCGTGGCETLVLVDAVPGDAPPGTIRVLEVGEDDLGTAGLDAHAMDPVTVLASLRSLGGRLPTTFVVGCVPATVDEAVGLSSAVAAAVEPAAVAVRALVAEALGGAVSSRARRGED